MKDAHQGKIRPNFDDYNYQSDLNCRVQLNSLTPLDVEVMEEILFGSLEISLITLAEDLNIQKDELMPTIHKLEQMELLTLGDNKLYVDREMRKYFEREMQRFEEGFRPGVPFLRDLMRKVPIGNLPQWYNLPRATDDIFASIIEKYLKTTPIFMRHFNETHFENEVANEIVRDLYTSADLKLNTSEIQRKYNLSVEALTEIIILLEFNLFAIMLYEKSGNGWESCLTPLAEWREHQHFLRGRSPKTLSGEVQRDSESEFPLIERLSKIMRQVQSGGAVTEADDRALDICTKLGFVDTHEDGRHELTPFATDWLEMRSDGRAANFYRILIKQLRFLYSDDTYYNEHNFREIEKALKPILTNGWITFDDFMRGTTAAFQGRDDMQIELMQSGPSWSYRLPEYSDEDRCFIKEVLWEWLAGLGLIQTGMYEGQHVLRVSDFGQTFFEE